MLHLQQQAMPVSVPLPVIPSSVSILQSVIPSALVGSRSGSVCWFLGSLAAPNAVISGQEGLVAWMLQTWLAGCRDLLVSSVAGVSSSPVVSPVPAWMMAGGHGTPVAGSIYSLPVLPAEAPASTQVAADRAAGSVVMGHVLVLADSASKTALESTTSDGASDGVRLSESAKCEIYVCFEGPLGAHLKRKNLEGGICGDIFPPAAGKV